MKQYLDALKQIIETGVDRGGRNGSTRALFGMQMRYDMADGFPAVTTKKLAFKVMKAELLGFLRAYSDVKDFQKLGCHVWDANADADYWTPRAAGLRAILGAFTVCSGGHGRHLMGKL